MAEEFAWWDDLARIKTRVGVLRLLCLLIPRVMGVESVHLRLKVRYYWREPLLAICKSRP